MKILLIHNSYIQPGGEDEVFHKDAKLLTSKGHDVAKVNFQNVEFGVIEKLAVGLRSIWSPSSSRSVVQAMNLIRPDLVHFHNTFPLVSPAPYYACQRAGVPVVQTLHNYRLLCPVATLYRDGGICEDCVGKMIPWPGTWNACYRDSHIQSAAVSTMLSIHNMIGSWRNQVDAFIALTHFAKGRFITGGLPAEKIHVKPNHLETDPGVGAEREGFVLFVGRLAEEKGVGVLLDAWSRLSGIPLKVVGDGPLRHVVEREAQVRDTIEWLGPREHEEVIGLMKRARFLVLPSQWYEGCPMTLIESFACGLPLIAPALGSLRELVEDGQHGLLFRASSADDLVSKVTWAWSNRLEMERMGEQARFEYERKYHADIGYQRLMDIYGTVLQRRGE